MGKYYTPEKRKSMETYWQKFEEIRVRCPNGTRQKYADRAEELELSLNKYALYCMERELEENATKSHRTPQKPKKG